MVISTKSRPDVVENSHKTQTLAKRRSDIRFYTIFLKHNKMLSCFYTTVDLLEHYFLGYFFLTFFIS